MWEVGRWVDSPGITLTTSLCDDWLSLLQSDAAFLAARVPIVPPAYPTQSFTIPLAIRTPQSAVLYLLQDPWPQTTVVSAPLELRPDRFTFANAELPSAPGEAYVALGLSQAPLACPEGLDIPPDDWHLRGSVWLDLQAQPDNCANCVLPIYYCYEGQDLPAIEPLPAALLRPLAHTAGLDGYQGQGITCLGPDLLTLANASAWHLRGNTTAWFTPTVPISFLHHLHLDS